MPLDEIEIIGCKVTLGDTDALLHQIDTWMSGNKQAIVVYGNAHAFNLAYESTWLRNFMNAADWVSLDGIGLRVAGSLLGHATPRRIAYADVLWTLACLCAERGYRVYLLGASEGVAAAAAARLRAHCPRLYVVGTDHGYFDKTFISAENAIIVQRVTQAEPDILLVGFGMPVQERWIAENRADLPVKVIMTCGGTLDYIAGTRRRAHPILRRFGFEWLGRLLIEPRRLWRRYLIGNPKFLFRVLRQRWRS